MQLCCAADGKSAKKLLVGRALAVFTIFCFTFIQKRFLQLQIKQSPHPHFSDKVIAFVFRNVRNRLKVSKQDFLPPPHIPSSLNQTC